jgi:lysozyme
VDTEQLERDLIRDEGLRLKPYKDSVGIETIGVGHNMVAKPLPAYMQAKLERDGCVTEHDAHVLLEADIADCVRLMDLNMPWWKDMTEPRQRALCNMCFNLGIQGLLGFNNTMRLMRQAQYDKAAANLAMSRWATQVEPRATRIIAVIKGE